MYGDLSLSQQVRTALMGAFRQSIDAKPRKLALETDDFGGVSDIDRCGPLRSL